MNIRDFLNDPDWDAPFFKRLAQNDTGTSNAHQAGMALPVSLRKYLPGLDGSGISPLNPTTDRDLQCELLVGQIPRASRVIRYQLQTWGGTRAGETRLTAGFQPLYDLAHKGDLIVFQRKSDSLDQFRLLLVRRDTPDFAALAPLIEDRHCGPLYVAEAPVTHELVVQANYEMEVLGQQPFQLFVPALATVESKQTRLARKAVFRDKVRKQYANRCSVSGIQLTSPLNVFEIHCAHIVPVASGGTNDVRNGITLSQTFHWAFDRGLFGITPERRIHVPRMVREMPQNQFLTDYHGRPLRDPLNTGLRAHCDALNWHMTNLVARWD